jgi:hypothetical protein
MSSPAVTMGGSVDFPADAEGTNPACSSSVCSAVEHAPMRNIRLATQTQRLNRLRAPRSAIAARVEPNSATRPMTLKEGHSMAKFGFYRPWRGIRHRPSPMERSPVADPKEAMDSAR